MEKVLGGVFKAMEKVGHPEEKYGFGVEARYDMDCLLVKDGEIWASEGAILARVDVSGLDIPDGIYRQQESSLLKNEVIQDATFDDDWLTLTQDGKINGRPRQAIYERDKTARWPEHYEDVVPEGEADVTLDLEFLRNMIDVMDAAGYTEVNIRYGTSAKDPLRFDGEASDWHSEKDAATVVISPIKKTL